MQKSNKIILGNNKFSEKIKKLFLNLVIEIEKKKFYNFYYLSFLNFIWNKNLLLLKKNKEKRKMLEGRELRE